MLNKNSKNLRVSLFEGDGDYEHHFMDDLQRQINSFLEDKEGFNVIDIKYQVAEHDPRKSYSAMVIYEPVKTRRELELERELSLLKNCNSIYEESLKEGKSLTEAQQRIKDEEEDW